MISASIRNRVAGPRGRRIGAGSPSGPPHAGVRNPAPPRPGRSRRVHGAGSAGSDPPGRSAASPTGPEAEPYPPLRRRLSPRGILRRRDRRAVRGRDSRRRLHEIIAHLRQDLERQPLRDPRFQAQPEVVVVPFQMGGCEPLEVAEAFAVEDALVHERWASDWFRSLLRASRRWKGRGAGSRRSRAPEWSRADRDSNRPRASPWTAPTGSVGRDPRCTPRRHAWPFHDTRRHRPMRAFAESRPPEHRPPTAERIASFHKLDDLRKDASLCYDWPWATLV